MVPSIMPLAGGGMAHGGSARLAGGHRSMAAGPSVPSLVYDMLEPAAPLQAAASLHQTPENKADMTGQEM